MLGRLAIAAAVLTLGCVTPAADAAQRAQEARERSLSECTAQMGKIINPAASEALQGCFARWVSESCAARSEQAYWESTLLSARTRPVVNAARDSLKLVREKQARIDADQKICVEYAERGQ